MAEQQQQQPSRRRRRSEGLPSSDGHKLLAAIMRDGATSALRQVDERWFSEEERRSYQFVDTYYRRYSRLPSVDALRENGVVLPEVQDAVDYYLSRCENRAVYQVYQSAFDPFSTAMHSLQMREATTILRRMLVDGNNLQSLREVTDINTEVEDFQRMYAEDKVRTGLKGITTGYAPVDEHTNGLQGGDVGILVARPNMGKFCPHYTPTLMADGTWKAHGDLQVGDELASIDGKPNVVQQLHPQGCVSNYRLTFSDGRGVDAGAPHLWRVYYRGWDAPRILKTSQIQEMLTKARYKKRLWIDRVSGEFGERKNFKIDPYLLGCLLGDGHLGPKAMGFTSADKCLVQQVTLRLPGTLFLKHTDRYNWVIQGAGKDVFRAYLRGLGLLAKTSHHKFVPDVYKSACREQRLDLLRGLLDTDGTVEGNGHVSFCSVSKQLALDVQELARSLGYWAKLWEKKRKSGDSWHVAIRGTGKAELFLLERKRQRILASEDKDARLTIESVEYVGDFESQCITVSHSTSLYVVKDYTVTHNTYLLLHMLCAAWNSGKSALVVSMEMTTQQIVKRLIAIMACIDPYFIHRGKLSYYAERRIADVVRGFSDMPPLHFVAGRFRKTMEDIDNYIMETSPDIVYIDGGYLLGDTRGDRRAARHEKLTNVIEDMKTVAMDRNRPIMTSVQFNREVRKNSKHQSMDLAQIAGTDAIGQIASLVMGIQQGPAGHRKDKRVVEVLKNREGELMKFLTNFKFSPINFGFDEMIVDEDKETQEHVDDLRKSME